MSQKSHFSWSFIGIIFIFSAILTSCADSRSYQCQKIRVLMQKMAKNSEKYRQADDIQKVLEVTDLFEETSGQMTALTLQDETLKTYQKGLAEVYQDYAYTTRKFVEALQNKDASMIGLMKKQVQRIGQKEQQLGEDLNRYCQKN